MKTHQQFVELKKTQNSFSENNQIILIVRIACIITSPNRFAKRINIGLYEYFHFFPINMLQMFASIFATEILANGMILLRVSAKEKEENTSATVAKKRISPPSQEFKSTNGYSN